MSEENKPTPNEETNKNAAEIFIEELTAGPPSHLPWWRRIIQVLTIPVLAIVSGLLVGAIIIILTTENFWSLLGQAPLQAIQEGLRAVGTAYSALFTGSLGDPARILAALESGDGLEIRRSINPIFESLVSSTPFIFAGLAVALGFRAGCSTLGWKDNSSLVQSLQPSSATR
jgi:general nucleoside transport system permease protein